MTPYVDKLIQHNWLVTINFDNYIFTDTSAKKSMQPALCHNFISTILHVVDEAFDRSEVICRSSNVLSQTQ